MRLWINPNVAGIEPAIDMRDDVSGGRSDGDAHNVVRAAPAVLIGRSDLEVIPGHPVPPAGSGQHDARFRQVLKPWFVEL